MIKVEIDGEHLDITEGVKDGNAWKMVSQNCYIFLDPTEKYPLKTTLQIPVKKGLVSPALKNGMYEISITDLIKNDQFEKLSCKVKYNKLKPVSDLKSVQNK